MVAALAVPAGAQPVCGGEVIEQIGTAVQYLTTTGNIRPGVLLTLNNPIVPTWNIVIFNAAGSPLVVTNVAQDQTQATKNTFAVPSCKTPF